MKTKPKLIGEFYMTVGIPLVYLVGLGMIYFFPRTMKLPLWLVVMGLIICFLGLGLWIVSYWYLRRAFGVLPKVQKRVSRGVYRYLKHPMYTGIVMVFLGLSVANQSWQGLALTLVGIPLLVMRAKLEERLLKE